MNTFATEIMNQYLFSIKQLKKRYERWKRERRMMINILQKMNQIIERIKVLRDNEVNHRRRMFLLKWISTWMMKQYYQDIWEVLYKFSFEFKGKKIEFKRQQWKRIESEIDSEDENSWLKKRYHIIKKNVKVVKKTWNESSTLTYDSIKNELKKNSLLIEIGKLYFNKKDFFRLIFQFDHDEMNDQNW